MAEHLLHNDTQIHVVYTQKKSKKYNINERGKLFHGATIFINTLTRILKFISYVHDFFGLQDVTL